MNCSHDRVKVWEVRRSKKRGLRRRLWCYGCRSFVTVYGGATAPELEKARATLRAKGYLL